MPRFSLSAITYYLSHDCRRSPDVAEGIQSILESYDDIECGCLPQRRAAIDSVAQLPPDVILDGPSTCPKIADFRD